MFKNCTLKVTHLLSFLLFVLVSTAQIKPTTADERQKGMFVRKELEKKSLLKDVKFRNIGPSVMSGRVVDVDVNPEDPTEFYVAYASGGLWHTKNNGQSFTPIFDNEDVMTIGDIAVKWYGSRMIWVGTGEVNSSRSSYAGNGVYKTADNGKTWEYLGLPESHHIGKLQLHPTDPNTAWVAALGHLYSPNKERGVYKTTDGGKTWKLTLAVDENTGAVEMEINPNNPNELYAAMWHRTRRGWTFTESGPTSGIYKSTDGGNSWKIISGPGSGFAEGKKLGRIGLSVYAQNPNIVYAVIDNYDAVPDTGRRRQTGDTTIQLKHFKTMTAEQFLALETNKLDSFMRRQRFPAKYNAASVKDMVRAGKLQPVALWDYFDAGDDGFSGSVKGCEVYRSDDAGKTWKLVNNKLPAAFSTYGYYFAKIYVAPSNPDKIVVLGVSAWMSVDAGKTFKVIDGRNVHADHHALWINPKRESHMINGNDGGINITYDDGANWYKANSPSLGQFYAITVDDAKPYNVYGGLQDNGTWYGPSTNRETVDWHDNGSYAFKSIGGGDGMQVQIDTRDNTTVYSGSQFGAYGRADKTKPFQGRVSVRPQHDLGDKPLRFNWQSPILLSKHNQDVFYFGTNRFHRSFNKGENAQNMSGDLTGGKREGNVPFGTLVTMTESPLRFGLIYTGSDDGYIHVTKDGGYSWTAVHTKLPKHVQGLYVSRVIASKYKESRVYAALNGYRNDHFAALIFVSDDYGTTWKQIFTDLPAEPVNVIREDPKQENLLYVGTDHGLYVSVDAGSSSMAWMSELPRVAIHDIAIQERENEIVLGTHGRSIYIASLNEVQKLAADKAYYEKKKSELK
ncbi:MAG: glycosyl hydrolase [Chitinophagaceae bacterium]|nr:glycosyl hydrolase [Chitinophagaceae bacterium]